MHYCVVPSLLRTDIDEWGNTCAACSEEWSMPILSRFGLAENHKIKAWLHCAKPWFHRAKAWRDEAKLGIYAMILCFGVFGLVMILVVCKVWNGMLVGVASS